MRGSKQMRCALCVEHPQFPNIVCVKKSQYKVKRIKGENFILWSFSNFIPFQYFQLAVENSIFTHSEEHH
jgi:hypothetical protein